MATPASPASLSAAASSSLPSTMRAWQFSSTGNGGLEKNLHLNTSAALPPHDGDDKVLVRVLAMSLNPVDYKIAEIPLVGRLLIKKPSSPGLDFAGRVVAATGGGGKDQAPEGDLVFGRLDQPTQFGTLAEYTVAPRGGLAKMPLRGVSVNDAACVGTAGLTAYQSIVPNVRRGEGDRVFINGGSGGTGIWGIQIAKALGCHVVTSCSGSNVQLCKDLGADEVVDYTSEDVVAALKKSVSTSGQKFALVVDNVGTSAALYWECHHFTTNKAKYVQVGTEGLRPGMELIMKFLWPGVLGGGKRKFELLMVHGDTKQLEEIGRWMLEGKLRAVVDQVVGMDDAPKAFEKLKTKHAKGKIVIVLGDGTQGTAS